MLNVWMLLCKVYVSNFSSMQEEHNSVAAVLERLTMNLSLGGGQAGEAGSCGRSSRGSNATAEHIARCRG
jgi:hypothetical protein